MNNNEFNEFFDNESNPVKTDSNLMNKVFMWMFVGILVSAVAALLTVNNINFLTTVLNPGVMIGLFIAEIVLVVILSSRVTSLSYPTAIVAFVAYSVINGLNLSVIFLAYEIGSIVGIFFTTAALFGLLAFVGYTIKVDLTRIGNILLIGLIGIIVCSLINLFIMNDTFDLILTIIGCIIFLAITVYDVQKIKNISESIPEENQNSLAIVGALTLYLDFINIFLKLLALFGKRRD